MSGSAAVSRGSGAPAPGGIAGFRLRLADFSGRHRSTSVTIGMIIVVTLLPLIVLLPPLNGFSSQTIWVNGFTIAGIGIGPINPIFGTLLYERVPEQLRARVFGAVR